MLAPAAALPPPIPSWPARLELGVALRRGRSTLVRRLHYGPLRVQKPLYPEAGGPVQIVILHPPGGIAAGDSLALQLSLGDQAQAQLTTPGATRWYRSEGALAQQRIDFAVGSDALLEWFPLENIVFNGARASTRTQVALGARSVFLGWEITCLGRAAAGERLDDGLWRHAFELSRNGRLLWTERAVVAGGGLALGSPVGLDAAPVFGTFVAAAENIDADALALARAQDASDGEHAVTRLGGDGGVIVARYRGGSTASAKAYFTALWRALRPRLCGRPALPPRIWST